MQKIIILIMGLILNNALFALEHQYIGHIEKINPCAPTNECVQYVFIEKDTATDYLIINNGISNNQILNKPIVELIDQLIKITATESKIITKSLLPLTTIPSKTLNISEITRMNNDT